MSAMTDGQLAVSAPRAALHGRGVSPSEFGMGLQLLRASTMATTRLQLALIRGDRRQAMDAMDWLLDIDTEIECFVTDLSPPQPDDPNWQAITTHLVDQKAAIACEKHALAGGITGRDAASPPELLEKVERSPRPGEGIAASAGALALPEAPGVHVNRWLLALLLLTVIGTIAASATLLVA